MKLTSAKKRGCAYWLRLLIVGLVGGLLVACAGIEVVYIDGLTRPALHPVCCKTPADFGLDYQNVTLTAADGVNLSGWYVPSKNRAAVILLHGYGGDRTWMLDQIRILGRRGYGALAYDLRAHGESGGALRTFGWLDAEDVKSALAFLQTRKEVDPARIGILGFSIGGQVAIRATAENNAIRAVVADDPGFVRIEDAPPLISWYENVVYAVNWIDNRGVELRTGVPAPPGIVPVVGKIAPRPILFIATGQAEGYRLVKHFYDLAGEPKSFWQIPEAAHGEQVGLRPQEYEYKISSFFDAALLK